MASNKSSQSQQSAAPNPFLTGFPGLGVWQSMMTAQAERFEQMLTEMQRLEGERHDRAASAIDDLAELMKSSLVYQRQLTDEWRKIGLDAAKKSAELVGAG